MEPGVILIIILAAAFVSIFIGYKKDINIGIIAIFFAYVLGVTVFGQPAGTILGLYPSNLFLTMMSLMVFYGYATTNGTLTLIAKKILYPFRNNVRMLPFIMFFCGMLLSAVAGNTAVTGFYPVLCYTIALSAGWDPLLFSCSSCLGVISAAALPWSQTGILISGILEKTAVQEFAQIYTLKIAIVTITLVALFIIGLYFYLKCYKVKDIEMPKPEKFNNAQIKTALVMLVVAIIIIVPSLGRH